MYPTILEVSFICLLGIAVIGKIGRHVRLLPPPLKKKKRGPDGKQECIYRRSCLLCTSYKVIS